MGQKGTRKKCRKSGMQAKVKNRQWGEGWGRKELAKMHAGRSAGRELTGSLWLEVRQINASTIFIYCSVYCAKSIAD